MVDVSFKVCTIGLIGVFKVWARQPILQEYKDILRNKSNTLFIKHYIYIASFATVKALANEVNTEFSIAASILLSRRWHTESNTLEKCKYMLPTGSPSPNVHVISPSNKIRFIRQERSGTTPC